MRSNKAFAMVVPIALFVAVTCLWIETARSQSQPVVSGSQTQACMTPADELEQHFQNVQADFGTRRLVG